jgi:hypothetical protein
MLHRISMVTVSALVLGSSMAARAEPAPAPDAADSTPDSVLTQGDNLLTLGAEVGWDRRRR